ncbi:hypothetical protein ECG_06794 [Echinococcus granulosus]|nr:hypothetical protein ECG_06794 [Echinococcus granulosus]
MAAVIGRFAAVGAKTGGKFATKAVTKKGGKGLAKGMGKMGKKKGLKKLVSGKGGKFKKLAECQVKDAIMDGTDDGGDDDEGPESGEKHSKKPIKIKSPGRRHKSPSSSKSKKGSKMKNHAKSKAHASSRRRHDTDDEDDDDTDCGGEFGDSDGEVSVNKGKSKKKGKSGDYKTKYKKETKDGKKGKNHKKHHNSDDESEVIKDKKDKEGKRKKDREKEKKKKRRSRDDSSDSGSEDMRKSEKRKGKKSDKKRAQDFSEDTCSDMSDSDLENRYKKHHKKDKKARKIDSEDSLDASDMECENMTQKGRKKDRKALSRKKKEKHNTLDDDGAADGGKAWKRRKRERKKDKKSGKYETLSDSEFTSSHDAKRHFPRNQRASPHPRSSNTSSSEEEVCVSLRDVRFRKKNRMDYGRREPDESDCCSQYTSPPMHISMRELCQVIKEVSNASGGVDVKRLTKSLAERAYPSPRLSPSSVNETKERRRADGSRNAAGDTKQNLTNSNKEKYKPKKEKQLRSLQKANAEGISTPWIEPPAQTETPSRVECPPRPVNTCEELVDRDFNMMLFKVAKELIMDEYQKKKNCEPEENDEWLRAFEMVVKFDNAKDIRAAQLKHEEMKLESKYLKKGQAKHFKRSGLNGGGGRGGNDVHQNEATVPDDGDGRGGGAAEGECRRRSKLDHLYDLIYALRGAPRKGGWKRNQLALPSNVDQSAATQLVPVYLPWELPQNDPYGAYYTDSYGYENQGYYQQC